MEQHIFLLVGGLIKHSTVGRILNTNGLKCQTMMHELYSADPYWNGMMNVSFMRMLIKYRCCVRWIGGKTVKEKSQGRPWMLLHSPLSS